MSATPPNPAPASAPAPAPSAIFGRDQAPPRPTIVRGEGVWLWDDAGNAYIDASSGAVAVISVGHGRQEVATAMAAQAQTLSYVVNAQVGHDVGEALAHALLAHAPQGIERALFFTGGSEANEAAIKLALQYHVVRGEPSRQLILSRRRSYHGMTIAALGVSGHPTRRGPFEPVLPWTPDVAPCNCYRCPFDSSFPSCNIACADDLERAILAAGPQRVAAFIAEPIVAAGGPGMTPPPGYFERIRAICDRYGVLWIADEVVTGVGRSGSWFAVEHWDAVPDLLTLAKGLSGGYAPLAALLIHHHIADTFAASGQPFIHGHTYMEHPVACAAGMAVLQIIEREDLVTRAADSGEYLFARLQDLASRQPLIGDVRGIGLLAGLELVADRRTRAPLPAALGVTQRLLEAARARGLLLYPGQSGEGTSDQLLVTPPLIVTREEIDAIIARLDAALQDVAQQLAALATPAPEAPAT